MINNISSIRFKSSEQLGSPATAPGNKPVKKETKHTTKNLIIDSTLTALAVVGVYLVAKKIKGNASSKIISLADFKSQGKFEKGKALLNNGKKFSGTITTTPEKGATTELVYENGLIKTAKDLTNKTSKTYSYTENGILKEIKKESEIIFKHKEENGISSYITKNGSCQIDTKNNKLLALGDSNGKILKTYQYAEDGSLQSSRKYESDKTIEVFKPDGKIDRIISTTEKEASIIFDENGKEIKRIQFNPEENTNDFTLKTPEYSFQKTTKKTEDAFTKSVHTNNASLYISKGSNKFGTMNLGSKITLKRSMSKKHILEISNDGKISTYNIKKQKFEKLAKGENKKEVLGIIKQAEQELQNMKKYYVEGTKLQKDIKTQIKDFGKVEDIKA